MSPPATLAEAALAPECVQEQLPEDPAPTSALPGYSDQVPVFVGHYWLKGEPEPLTDRVACVDYSVAKDGKLCAYRWEGEANLDASRFLWVEP